MPPFLRRVGSLNVVVAVIVLAVILSLFTNTMRIIKLGFVGSGLMDDSFSIDEVKTSARRSWWLHKSYRGTRDGGGNLVHPHMGARHPNGSIGMVVDPSVERLREPVISQGSIMLNSSSANKILCPTGNNSFGIEGEGANKVMHKIRRGLIQAQSLLHDQSKNNHSLPGEPVRILCMIYTVHTPEGNHSLQAAIADTWGRKCDGFIGASNLTDHEIGTIDLLHQGPEEYSNLWQKIRSMWTYAFDYYSTDYDYFYITGDDTYVLMDHMRLFLQSEQVERLKHGHLDRISQYYIIDRTQRQIWFLVRLCLEPL